MTAISPGRFVWHEVLTTDPDAALAFYTKVIGWTLMPWDRDPNYRMFAWNNVPRAAVMRLPDEARASGAPSHWLTYISVRDVDAAVGQAAGMGARTYLEPMDIPTVGRIAVMADPQGATFAVFRPESAGHVTDELAIGDFSWHELAADDWKAAWEFYRALFGWEPDHEFDMGPMGTYFMFRRAGGTRTLGGIYNRPPDVPMANWLPYVHVASADETAARIGRHGGRLVGGPMEVPGGSRVAQLADPQGAMFAVHSVAPASTAPARKPVAAKQPALPKAVAKKPVKKAAPKKKPVKKR